MDITYKTFDGLNTVEKSKLRREYFKVEWKDILISIIFIILSSNENVFSLKNEALYVLIWFIIATLFSLCAYVNQSDCMKSRKRMRNYCRKHNIGNGGKGPSFVPEIGGWTKIAMQLLVAIIVYIIAVPIALGIQMNDFKVYMAEYRSLFIGLMCDTYIVTIYAGIQKATIESIYDINKGRNDKNIILKKRKNVLKNTLTILGAIIILALAFYHYFNSEFEGFFDVVARRIVGGIYILYLIYPLLLCIYQIIKHKRGIKGER
ncbi:MAG: hypothetical protein K5669_11290 [Lachnospiraceae bacterium]|nr:hypothetical protein [Lachnospiraceae bacterium]